MTTFDTVLELLAMWVQRVLILLVAGLVTQCAFSGSGNRHAGPMGDHKIQHIRPGDDKDENTAYPQTFINGKALASP